MFVYSLAVNFDVGFFLLFNDLFWDLNVLSDEFIELEFFLYIQLEIK